MPNITPIQQSFAAGEITPRLWMRSETAGHQSGCREMVNFIAKARGPAKSRDGFRYLGGIAPFPGESVIAKTVYIDITTPSVDVQVT